MKKRPDPALIAAHLIAAAPPSLFCYGEVTLVDQIGDDETLVHILVTGKAGVPIAEGTRVAITSIERREQ